ncbi:helix-turn-helix domain protein [Rhizobium sp. CF080]|uniref:helix-turn-helix domain-containing protein n=1 Tax=Rhizobium sp. (strain CF080) TaxID=1144310 RepID=UPI0002717808|nr:helix-turn-helix transcriptional regulator [Rhizobium sp. CF080]EUB96507.1 helix-turn-helix domain protein [Rhizobium sp. CF080]
MTDTLKQAIGSQVKAARERRRWTQEELAAKIGKTPESVSNIERSVHLPALDTLIDLAAVLDLDIMGMIDAGQSKRRLSKKRLKQEAEIAMIVRDLSDAAVAIAAQQIAALDRVK